MTSQRTVLAGLCLAALLTAGGLSYLASSAPDGLDAVTRLGCPRAAGVPGAAPALDGGGVPDGGDLLDGGNVLEGGGVPEGSDDREPGCIARDARDGPLARGPLAGYGVDGHRGLTGAAGVLGVLVTLGLAAGLFRLLRRRPPSPVSGDGRQNAHYHSRPEPAAVPGARLAWLPLRRGPGR